ncbi:hypothetical protein PCANC_15247 [Puccinia coronata f. sp. avenae]|uniref:Uncharacterized protein n=1 Tax=Puccinia coronata f. sp. avenae TaxID=200324 RepID=A0A2N5VNJ3_9BASI|nr:hypothetical protein PCANC_15247 [Puccinia coronata f. sp. avenae]
MLPKLVPAQQAGLHACKAVVPAQRAGLPACRAGTSPASRPTCSPSWYQPSEQAYLLTERVPAQQAGLPARQAGTTGNSVQFPPPEKSYPDGV